MDGTSRFWGQSQVRLANMEVPISITATIPSFNATTGYFSDLRIQNFELEPPKMNFPRQPYAKMLNMPFFLSFAEGTANQHVQEHVLPRVNEQLEKSLAQLPLRIHPLRNVPRRGLALQFAFESASLTSIVDQEDSYLTLDADLGVSILDLELRPEPVCEAPLEQSTVPETDVESA